MSMMPFCLPVKAKSYREDYWEVRDANNAGVTGWGQVTTTREKAEAIALAINSHEQLVKALRFVAEWHQMHAGHAVFLTDDCMSIVRSALAAAGETK